ncbi:MAG: Gfo/Idh/MocA family oxidoreductase [Lentisphaerae bacterium]|nr:Gfo/Idh/MocA family oxidoreductase [Lentisphaerota bacterium]MBT4822386.1 Gfo/Idh/MocA family oxidoreductase [Lentisphaerota bacterium]MBT5611361.1 Gfo/Idh/MocA family oxidoreductase [Lentisphaerota bacterium]MBT7061542.1 Gfo/Idh/MocA family oxidoreductase [Lentisphaerota bacterium]MBT7842266.1 Gfo/Idh/MocA family oxidoreductase [Lentisphaerota bacterium]
MTVEAIRIGVCGIGRSGKQHCRVFSRDRESYELVALCDLDPARVSATAARPTQATWRASRAASYPTWVAIPSIWLSSRSLPKS